MTTPVRLKEYKNWVGDLEERDAEFVAQQLSPRIGIRREVATEQFVLNPGQFVGVVVLPSGRRLESHPKVPVRNLFYMLAVAFEFPSPFRKELVAFDELDRILEFVASYFADLVEERIDKGLYRSYEEREDNLAAVRGQIVFAEDVRHNYVLRHRTYCRYAELTWDIPENQIIRQVAHLLSGWDFRPEVRLRLGRIDAALADVETARFHASVVDDFRYHRLNEDYRHIHQQCRLFLDASSISEDVGPFDFRTFLLDMNRLFELFVTQSLRERATAGTAVSAQEPLFLGHEKKVSMQPDIVFRRNGEVALVGDCKYKRIESDEFKNHDMYQMLAYCTAAHVERGVLIYPRHTTDAEDEVRIRNTGCTIQQTTIDLGRSGGDLDLECDRLAAYVFALLRG